MILLKIRENEIRETDHMVTNNYILEDHHLYLGSTLGKSHT